MIPFKPMFRLGLLISGILIISFLTQCKKDPVKGWSFYIESAPPPKIDTLTSVIKNCEPPYPVTFYQATSNRLGTMHYKWDFGDGHTSLDDLNPTHIYDSLGDFQIKLIVWNEIGSDTAILSMPELNQSSVPIIAGFSYTHFNNNNYAPSLVNFTNSSSGANIFAWYFGDGGQDNNDDPTHEYLNAGTYTVKLRGTCTNNTYNEVSQQIFINPAPQRVFIDSLNLMLPSGSGVYVEMYHNTTYVGRTTVKSGSFPIKYRRPNDFIDGYFFDFVQFTNNEVFKFVVLRDNSADPPTFLYEILLSSVDIQNRHYPRYYYQIETVPALQDVFIDLYMSY